MSRVNRNVRAQRGAYGDIVVTSAYCPGCRMDSMPLDDGTCAWCGRRIVDEDKLRSKPLSHELNELAGERPSQLRALPGTEFEDIFGDAA